MALTQGHTAVVDNPMAAIRDAYMNDSDPMAAVYGGDSSAAEEPEQETVQEEEVAEQDTDAGTTEPSQAQATSTPSDIETVYVKDEKGQKQKLDISYADKQKIKEAYLKAAGMHKFRQERDSERKSKAEIQKKLEDLTADFGKLDRVFKDKGAKGLFELLGGQGSWEKAVENEIKQREHFAQLSPEERMQHHMQEKEKVFQSEKSELEKKYQTMLEKIEQQNTQATVRSLESKLSPAFEKHRFKGKLGDDAAEGEIDDAIWTKVTKRLSEYPEEVELTQGIIEKEFRSVSSIYKNLLEKQTDSRVKLAVDKKKQDAASRVQVVTKKGMASQGMESGVAEDIKNSNWSSLMQRVMLGKAKL